MSLKVFLFLHFHNALCRTLLIFILLYPLVFLAHSEYLSNLHGLQALIVLLRMPLPGLHLLLFLTKSTRITLVHELAQAVNSRPAKFCKFENIHLV